MSADQGCCNENVRGNIADDGRGNGERIAPDNAKAKAYQNQTLR